jgi:hypothetical protein
VAVADYFEVTLAPLAQQRVSLATLSFEHRKSGAEAGATLFVRSSADGYAATLGAVTLTGSNVWYTSTFPLAAVAALQKRAVPVTLRIYAYKPAPDSGQQRVSIDAISVTGAAQSNVGSRTATVLMVK